MKSDKLTILYVDDEETNLNVFRNTFRREYNVLTALSGKEGYDILKQEKVDLILTDQRMPEMTGVEFLKSTLSDFPELNRILVTGYTDFGALSDAINQAQISQFIQKPWDEFQLREVIEKNLESYRLKSENKALKQKLEQKNIALEKANYELLAYDRLKSDFLAIISHEVRTPLNGLIGPFEMLKYEIKDHPVYSKLENLITILDLSVKRLEQFALSALHITHLKAHRYELVITENLIGQQIDNVVALYTDEIQKKGLKVTVVANSQCVLKADKELVYICIKEVIDNAIKYCDRGGTIVVELIDQPDNIIIKVSDQGKGFSENVLNHLFDSFVIEDKFTGISTGLDLPLVKLIVDAHNGSISCYNSDSGAVVEMEFKHEIS